VQPARPRDTYAASSSAIGLERGKAIVRRPVLYLAQLEGSIRKSGSSLKRFSQSLFSRDQRMHGIELAP